MATSPKTTKTRAKPAAAKPAATKTAAAEAATNEITSAAEETMAVAASIAEEAMAKSAEMFSGMGFGFPDSMREASERSLAQAREGYAKLKANAEETTDLMEETMETAREGLLDFQAGALDAAKAHTDATFAFMKELMGAQSMADAVQLQTAFARERFEAMVDYSKDMQTRIGTFAEQTSKPAKVAFEKIAETGRAA
jgi:phasin